MTGDAAPIMGSLREESIPDILENWSGFVACTETLTSGNGDLSVGSQLIPLVAALCSHGLVSLVQEHFLQSLEETFKTNAVSSFWQQFDAYCDASRVDVHEDWPEEVLTKSLEEICAERTYLEKCLLILVHALQSCGESITKGKIEVQHLQTNLISRYQLMVSSVLLTTLPQHFPEVLRMYFKKKLKELSNVLVDEYENESESQSDDHRFNYQKKSSGMCDMDIDGSQHATVISSKDSLVKSIGKVVRDLRSLGFLSLTEDAYASAIFLLLKNKVHSLAGDEYRIPVLESVKEWIQAVPLQFLSELLAYLGESFDYGLSSSGLKPPLASCPFLNPGTSTPSEGLVRWQLRLEYFAYETLQDLRIGKLFEIIVDYPDSSPAIEDLKKCIEYTGQHSKLVDSFISSLRYRLLTAGASTNDILHQYVSTIKALRTIDPAGVFLEAVGEPIRDYLKGRKDTIKCIVTMLTDGAGGNPTGTVNNCDSLLEELNRDAESQENVDCDEDINSDDKQAWIRAERWEPDPLEVDPSKGGRSRRKIDILAMMVSIIGSKDQLVNEYRVMLAEKLLNKSDYDIDSEIRTLELLKIHFGESSMQRCEIMTNDLIHSKRTNASIKASIPLSSLKGSDKRETNLSLDILDVTIISSNFWPPIQEETLIIPSSVDKLFSDYSKRFHEIKTPRKLLWKKNLGTVKLELQFEDRMVPFSVTPVQATIIMQFQEHISWTSKNLAAAVGIPVDLLNRRISFWVSKGILTESIGEDCNDHVFTLVEDMTDANRKGLMSGGYEGLLAADEEGDRSMVSVEEQLRKVMGSGSFFKVVLKNFDVLAGPVVTLVYPLYASVMAIETKSPVDDQQWLTYWVLYSLITLFELTFAKVIGWLPFWPYVKLIFNCWLVLPYFSGAAYVYEHYVRPLFVNQQTVNIWYVPRKKGIFSRPDDVLVAAEKFIEENGPEAFQKLLKKTEKGSKHPEKAEHGSKPPEKAEKAEKGSKLGVKAPKPRKTNRRVTFDDVEIEKTANAQKSSVQTKFDGNNKHVILDDRNHHPIYDEDDAGRESNSWSNSSFMIFDDGYRY